MESIIQKIIKQATANPDQYAIIGEGFNVTYDELIQTAFEYANGIAKVGLQNTWIGINVNLGWKAYAAILGCWITGNGYVPLNLSFPEKRIASIVNQTGLTHCIGSSSLNSINPLPRERCTLVKASKAYLLFTSGTTGEPKGVPISQENLSTFCDHYLNHDRIDFTSNDKFLQSYELTFDVSVFCFVMPFIVGGALVLPHTTKSKQLGLFKAISEYEVTVTSFVPSVIRLTLDFLPRIQFPHLRYSFFSGEALMGTWAKVWMDSVPNAKVFNCYGPTETVIVCTEELLNELDESYFTNGLPLPLGKPFKGVNLILEKGEVIFSGPQTFTGYINQSKLHSYASGDLGHYDQNGKLLFDGRKDNQVQWNGFRIELEAIELEVSRALNSWCKVVFDTESNRLHLFSLKSKNDLLMLFDQLFPKYYLPSHFHTLNEIPLNSNGKVDVALLNQMMLEL